VPIATGHEREEIQADLEVSLSLSLSCVFGSTVVKFDFDWLIL
jgi:hypothetical protein